MNLIGTIFELFLSIFSSSEKFFIFTTLSFAQVTKKQVIVGKKKRKRKREKKKRNKKKKERERRRRREIRKRKREREREKKKRKRREKKEKEERKKKREKERRRGGEDSLTLKTCFLFHLLIPLLFSIHFIRLLMLE